MKNKKYLLLVIFIVLIYIVSSCTNQTDDTKNNHVYEEAISKFDVKAIEQEGYTLTVINEHISKDYESVEQAIFEEMELYEETNDFDYLYNLCFVLYYVEKSLGNKDSIAQYFSILFERIENENIEIKEYTYIEKICFSYINYLWNNDNKEKAKYMLNRAVNYSNPNSITHELSRFMNHNELNNEDKKFMFYLLLDIEDEIYDKLTASDKVRLIEEILILSECVDEYELISEFIEEYGNPYVQKWIEIGTINKDLGQFPNTEINSLFINDIYIRYNPDKHSYDEVIEKYLKKYERWSSKSNLKNLCYVLLFYEPGDDYYNHVIKYYDILFNEMDNDEKFTESMDSIYSDLLLNYLYALYDSNLNKEYKHILYNLDYYDLSESDTADIIEHFTFKVATTKTTTQEDRNIMMDFCMSWYPCEESFEKRKLGVIAMNLGLESKALELFISSKEDIIDILKKQYLITK